MVSTDLGMQPMGHGQLCQSGNKTSVKPRYFYLDLLMSSMNLLLLIQSVPADGWLGELKQLKTDLPYISLTPNLAYQINSELNLMVSVILLTCLD